MSEANPIPKGFESLNRISNFVNLFGPVYQKKADTTYILALRVEEKHCNIRGNLHGGVVSSLADTAMGYNIAFSEAPPISSVTVNLTVDYIGRIQKDDWLEAHVDIEKKGNRIVFVSCRFFVDGKKVARANGVFNLLTKK
ncbi:MAG: PaaI family thioesterase [Cellvibrionaceae bacterium]